MHQIDHGNAFDWGRTSQDYAKYRDIYPELLYQKLLEKQIGLPGQKILDIGTGTGVIPRNMYRFGADWTGTDASANQIAQAKLLAEQQNMQIDFRTVPAEELDFPEHSFDAVTACQCFWYFRTELLMPVLQKILRPDGKLCILQMMWLPFEDKIAQASENLVLQYNPAWTGAGETRHSVYLDDTVLQFAELVSQESFDIQIPFTRETWHGRMKACRGVGASLTGGTLAAWEQEHIALLNEIADEHFEILHSVSLAELKLKPSQKGN